MTLAGGWEFPQEPLVICVPHQSKMTAEWNHMFNAIQKPPMTVVQESAKLPVDCARDKMVFDSRRIFERMGWDTFPDVFFIDSDVLMAAPDLMQLLSYPRDEFPIVSGLYWAKKGERCPAAWTLAKQEYDVASRYAPAKIPDYGTVPVGRLQEVAVVGAGCLLIRGEVFEKVPSPWFFFGTGRTHSVVMETIITVDKKPVAKPVVDVEVSEDYMPPLIIDAQKTKWGWMYGTDHKESEDFYFCAKARSYGIPIMLDSNIRCHHECSGHMNGDGYPVVGGD